MRVAGPLQEAVLYVISLAKSGPQEPIPHIDSTTNTIDVVPVIY